MPRDKKKNRRRMEDADEHAEQWEDAGEHAEHQDDQGGQPFQAYHTLRPHKLRRFSGEEGAEDFIREATLMLQLQPMPDSTAAGWLLSSLEGRARQQILTMEKRDVDTPAKIFAVLEQHWGEQRDSSALAGAFFKRQQGLAESVGEYAAAMRVLWTKTNTASADTLSPDMLRDAFANGLHPHTLRRDVKRFLREKPDTSFTDATREAQRWMREDCSPADTPAEPTTPDCNLMRRLEAQIAALTTETVSLKQQLQEQQRPAMVSAFQAAEVPSQASQPEDHQTSRQVQSSITCWWCQRQGHREAECGAKRQYQRRRARQSQQQRQQQGNY